MRRMPLRCNQSAGQSVEGRFVIAQPLDPFGALLCVIDISYSIRFIVLAQRNDAIAPRLGILARL